MKYYIQELAKMAGITTKTLRHYDRIGLLRASRDVANTYRVYGEVEVDRLQQILLFREMGMPLNEIAAVLDAHDFDRRHSLEQHLKQLQQKQDQLAQLIDTVTNTIQALEGDMTMNNEDKFKGFINGVIQENETHYGKEARERYGDTVVDQSNEKLRNISQTEYRDLEALTLKLNETMKQAKQLGDPSSDLAQEACRLHKKWLMHYWADYSAEAHLSLVQMYVDDPRFTAYYDAIEEGLADFLLEAMTIYLAG